MYQTYTDPQQRVVRVNVNVYIVMYIAVNPRVFGVMFPLNSMCSQKSSFISRLLYSTYVGDDCVSLI